MTLLTKGMGAVASWFKPRGKKITELTEKMIRKGVVDRNVKSKDVFKIIKGLKK